MYWCHDFYLSWCSFLYIYNSILIYYFCYNIIYIKLEMKPMEIVILKNRNIMSIPESLIQEMGYFVKVSTVSNIQISVTYAYILINWFNDLYDNYFTKYLYLDNNIIRTLPDELFTGCTNLMWLDLRCNRIRRLPDGVQGHKNLQVLLLGKNDLKRLPLTLGM